MKTAFNDAIARAKDEGNDWLAKRLSAERDITAKVVSEALKAGCVVTVNDGEDDVLTSDSMAKLMQAVFSTDEDWLLLTKDGDKAGWFCLVYGNTGWDVVNDHSANPVCEAIMKAVEPLCDTWERKLS